ncbi:splicing factor u2af large subunit [Cordyceps militaris CM01]|uniref:Splicing factor U2AF subunit n=1 Tax=Cordyceps militaris (strain CM01) TaxID=983644 RepID=G3J8M9_CORMM|nr:splicing factor u2af large subunit [Cordyceps militaris CM01]EGX93964.1 splicing factor u2af large subunit [Cordyceps militaris CM01]
MNGDNYSSRGESVVSSHNRANADGMLAAKEGDGRRDHQSSRSERGDRGDRGDRDRGDRRDRGDDRRDRHRDRRRSRSPDLRQRRDRDRDGDAYASSRNHRDREREERYTGGRDRRGGPSGGGDREWDRDRGTSRRDARRDDDVQGRRDRDGGDDHRRGGRDRRDDGFARQQERRSPSPPKRREPTPDLTDIIPVLERKRRMTQWDIKPPGYEAVTSEQAKMSGMFPLPGAPRQQQVDPTKLQALMNQPAGGQVSSAGLKANNSRQARRLLVSDIPSGTTEDALVAFFNLQLNGLNVIEATDPCALCQLSNDKSFAVLEFKNTGDATVALALDGSSMVADTPGLSIRRPKDYVMPAVPDEIIFNPEVVSNSVPDTIHKLCITNIPPFLTEDQVLELLAAFGKPKAFVLVKERSTEESRGIAFAEYVEPTNANEPALNTLNGMDVGGKKLKARKACVGGTQVANFDAGINAISNLAGQGNGGDATRVLQLLNMVTAEELLDNDDYEEICEDVRDECSKYGKVLDVKVPRPAGGSRQSAGVGRIFVKFESVDSTTGALKALAGRKFADRTVVTTYFPEENFDVGAW